jgi:hypothetical protein
MGKESDVVSSITQILTDFALTKFSANALEVKGPVEEGGKYRWRIVSTRFKDVTVVLATSKPLFGPRKLKAIQVFGTTKDRDLKPNLDDLRTYLETAELIKV